MRNWNSLALVLLLAGCHRVAPYAAEPVVDGSAPPTADGSRSDADGGDVVEYRIEMALSGSDALVHGSCRPVVIVVVAAGTGRYLYRESLDIGLSTSSSDGLFFGGSACDAGDRVTEVAYLGQPVTVFFKYAPDTVGRLTQSMALRATPMSAEVAEGNLAVMSRAPAEMVAAGSGHSCALVAGTIQCWGGNDRGQLGNGSRRSSLVPGALSWSDNLGFASQVSVGARHSCGVVDGAAYCWGLNFAGQLGDGVAGDTRETQVAPVAVVGLEGGVSQVAVGNSHSCAVRNGGALCWGSDWTGQLGHGAGRADSAEPVPVTGLGSGVRQVSVAHNHSCALVRDVSGTRATDVWCWGRNSSGELGQDPDEGVYWEPVRVPLPEDDHVISGVAAGSAHSCAVVDGGVMCWGANGRGQLGASSVGRLGPAWVEGLGAGSSVVALAAGFDHACAVTEAGGVLCWGANEHGQVGVAGDAEQPKAVEVPGLSGVSHVAASVGHTCAVSRGAVVCWGRGDSGQLGGMLPQLASTPRLVPGLMAVTRGAGGEGVTCAVTSMDGRVMCWGRNEYGQLGDGSRTTRAVPTLVGNLQNVALLAAGQGHVCAASDDPHEVYCWGQNYAGQLGTGDGQSALEPVAVATLKDLEVRDLSSLGRHSCALVGDAGSELVCWGRNGAGELGDGTDQDRGLPMATVLDALGGMWGDTEPQMVSAGADHTCAVVAGGVACWGSNYQGQCGFPATEPILEPTEYVPGFAAQGDSAVVSVAAGEHFSCALKGGQVTCWGRNWHGELGRGDYAYGEAPSTVIRQGNAALVEIAELAVGAEHACARDARGGVFCWGANASGQLGDGTRMDSNRAVSVVGLPPVQSIFAGSRHSCAVAAQGQGLWCWGSNAWGGIGMPWVMRVVPHVVAPWAD